MTENQPEQTQTQSFEDEVLEESKKYARKMNKIRLIKWLAGKDSAIRTMEAEVKEMISDCKEGDFSGLPDLTPKEKETLDQNWATYTINSTPLIGSDVIGYSAQNSGSAPSYINKLASSTIGE